MTPTEFPALDVAGAVKRRALELGFAACGITDLAPVERGDVLDRWLKAGYGGTMRYLNRQARKRKDPGLIDLRAKSVVVCLDGYYYGEENGERRTENGKGEEKGEKREGRREKREAPLKVARYARGEDYHRVTLRRLDLLGDFLRDRGARWTRSFADSGPVPERELAQRAGLGWMGKNTMLIRPGLGSWFVIGSVFSDLVLAPDEPFVTDHCGSCTRCLDACPTVAFVGPRVLDATRCISYQTIEKAGAMDPGVAERLNGWIFGCDICNDVCPWNERFAEASRVAEFAPRAVPPLDDPEYFARMTEMEFHDTFWDTPLGRAGLARLRRNVAAAGGSMPPVPPATLTP
jgi:epoxyqueuosine reductase